VNHPKTNRRDAGKPTPPCPDCGVHAVPSNAAALLPGQPRIHHERSCPTLRAALVLLADDLDWFEAHPGEGLLFRPLTGCELDEMHVALGRRVPRSQRDRWYVSVSRYRSGVLRAYGCGGHITSIQVVLPDPAGAA